MATWPDSLIPSYASSWEFEYPVSITRLSSGKEKRIRSTTYRLFKLNLVFKKMTKEELDELTDFFISMNGKFNTFVIPDYIFRRIGVSAVNYNVTMRFDSEFRVEVNEYNNYNVSVALIQTM